MNNIIGQQYSDTDYRLSDNITRAEMAKVAANIAGLPVATGECTGAVFNDVDDTYGDLCVAIESMAAAGFVSTANAGFRPNDNVTRAEMVKMLLGATCIDPTAVPAGFSDASGLGDLTGYINAAGAYGIVTVRSLFRPNDNSTRGEAFKVASNAMANNQCSAACEGEGEVMDMTTGECAAVDVAQANCEATAGMIWDADAQTCTEDMECVICQIFGECPARCDGGVTPEQECLNAGGTWDDATETCEDPCPAGQSMNDAGECINVTTCDVDEEMVDGECVPKEDPTECPDGEELINGECVPQDVVGCEEGEILDEDGNCVAAAIQGELALEIASDNYPANVIPAASSAIPYLKFTIQAGEEATAVNSITLLRSGLGTRDDLRRVWIEQDGVRISERASFLSDDTAKINFFPAMKLAPNEELTLHVFAEQDSPASRVNAVSIVDATYVDATGTVSGSFPISGNNMTTAAYAVATVDVVYQGATTEYKVGDEDAEFFRVQLLNNSTDKDVKMVSLQLRNNESGDIEGNLDNIGLYEGGEKVSKGYNVDGRNIQFLMKDDYVIKAGVTKTFTLQADAINVDNTQGDKYNFEIRYAEHVNAREVSTGFGVNVTWAGETTSQANSRVYTVKGATITVTRSADNPATQTVSQGMNDVTLLIADARVQQGFRVDGMAFNFDVTGVADEKVSDSFGNIRVYIDDKIYDSFEFEDADTITGDLISKQLESSWIFEEGNYEIRVVANAKSNATINTRIKAALDTDAFTVSTGDTNNPTTTTAFQSPRYLMNDNNVLGGDMSIAAEGQYVTIGSDNVQIVRNDGYHIDNNNIVSGARNAVLYRGTISAGTVSDVKVTKLQADVETVTGKANLLTNWRVIVDGEQNGSSRAISTTADEEGAVSFSSLNFTIPKNGVVTVEILADVSSSFVNDPLTDGKIDVAISDEGSIFQNVLSGQTIDAEKVSVTPAAVDTLSDDGLTVKSAGEITVAKDGNTTTSRVVTAGQSDVEVAKFRLASKYDNMYVKSLILANVADLTGTNTTDTQADSRVRTLKLYDAVGNKVAEAPMTNGYVAFTMSENDLVIDAEETVVLTVKADFNYITAEQETGRLLQLAIADIDDSSDGTVDGKAVITVDGSLETIDVENGLESGLLVRSNSTGNNVDTTNVTVGNTTTEKHQIRKTKLTVASKDLSSSLFTTSQDKEIYRFTVTADAAGDAYLKKFTQATVVSNATAENFKVYRVTDQSDVLASDLNTIIGTTDVAQVNTVTLAGTPEVDDVYSVTVDGVTSEYTVVADDLI